MIERKQRVLDAFEFMIGMGLIVGLLILIGVLEWAPLFPPFDASLDPDAKVAVSPPLRRNKMSLGTFLHSSFFGAFSGSTKRAGWRRRNSERHSRYLHAGPPLIQRCSGGLLRIAPPSPHDRNASQLISWLTRRGRNYGDSLCPFSPDTPNGQISGKAFSWWRDSV
jgi:hypothetical protein